MTATGAHDDTGAPDTMSGETYLIVINSLGAGGAEKSLADILPYVADSGVRPVVACFKSPDVGFEDDVRGAGVDVRVLDGTSMAGHITQLRKLIKETRPSLVYTALFDAHIAGRIAAAGTGVPVLSNLTNVAYDPARYLDPNVNARRLRIIRHVDGWTARHLTTHFHAVSGAVKTSAVEHLGVDPSVVSVVYRGRHIELMGRPGAERKRDVRASLGIDDGRRVLITVGRQEYQKGHRHLLGAMPALIEEYPDILLLVAGRRGHLTPDLEKIVSTLGLGDNVEFLGHRTDVADLLAAADVFVFPSVYEGLGGAALEAMALGLPMVVSDVPALGEVVEVGHNGVVVPPADARALVEAISDLLGDPDLMERYGARSRQIFEEKFDARDAIPATVALMHEVAAKGR